MKLKNLIIGVIIVTILIALKFIFFPNQTGNAKASQQKKGGGNASSNVTAYVVKPQKINNEITASGTIRANEEVQLQPEISGKITQLNFKEGGKVSKGQILVKLNDSDFQAQYKKLQLQLALSDRTMQRQKQLLAINGISQQEFDQAQSEYNTIKADMDFQMAQILKTEIKAPFDGVIGLKNVSEGAFVSPSTIIASIQQIDPVKIDFSVPERYFSYLKKDGEVIFSIEGVKEELKGKIFAIEPKIDQATRTVQIRAICSNAKENIYPGAFAQVKIVLNDIDDAIMIPTESLIPDISGQKVFILKNGKDYGVLLEDKGIATRGTFIIDPEGIIQYMGIHNLNVGLEAGKCRA
ncbi:MAG TPA: efflux RND transporter periplasmic adaptor subunit, partial [Bacteroidia bacterium]|nr:efflux RND transporter periplasmic adaptor subunit [Bacteroidia bacterium]